VESSGAVLIVEDAHGEREAFVRRHGVMVDAQPVRLSQMFKVWTAGAGDRAHAGVNGGGR
jgi:hypothetical protein